MKIQLSRSREKKKNGDTLIIEGKILQASVTVQSWSPWWSVMFLPREINSLKEETGSQLAFSVRRKSGSSLAVLHFSLG